MTNRLEMQKLDPIVWKWDNRIQSSGNGKTEFNRLERSKPNPIVWKCEIDSIRLEMTNRLEMRKQIQIVWKCEN